METSDNKRQGFRLGSFWATRPTTGRLAEAIVSGVWGFGRMTGFSGVGLRVPECFGNYEEFMGFGFYCGFRVEGWVVWVLE